ncbi:MAG: hypothetical protein KAS62_11230, partial [Candidatus Delongbacteria bacterium]|nr:hypothetical protein [Candidatus Delongbacteria bacterium]
KILKEAGLIVQERDEKYINYSLNISDKDFIKNILSFVKRLDDEIFSADKRLSLTTDRANVC